MSASVFASSQMLHQAAQRPGQAIPVSTGAELAAIPATLRHPGAARFWLAILATGVATGLAAGLLTLLLEALQHLMWPGAGEDLLEAGSGAGPWRHILVLTGAGLMTGLGQFVLGRLTNANSIDTTQAIWQFAGRLPAVRTLGSALLSIVIVAMGTSLGREGAPKQAGAVIANGVADKMGLSDEQRRLIVACGAGAGLAAAYGVPLGGGLFALEVLRGALALRLVLPALFTSITATIVSWTMLPDVPTYVVPRFSNSTSAIVWSLVAGPIAGLVSVGFVRAIAAAEHHKPKGRWRYGAPLIALAVLGAVSIPFPQLLGNGKDVSQLAFAGQVLPPLVLALVILRPAATIMCVGAGAPGGLFTPSLTLGALLGAVLGHAWSWFWPGVPPGLFAVMGAAAVVAATTQGPISAIVLLMEMTGRDRSLVVPLLLSVITANLTARTIDRRSIYDAHLSDEDFAAKLKAREPAS